MYTPIDLERVTEADASAYRELATKLVIEHEELLVAQGHTEPVEQAPLTDAQALEEMRACNAHYIWHGREIIGLVGIDDSANRISRIALKQHKLNLAAEVFRHIQRQHARPAPVDTRVFSGV